MSSGFDEVERLRERALVAREAANTVSLVTGGNRGIGLEVCRQLAERGHSVLLTARSADAAAAPLA